MPDLTRQEAERLLAGLRNRREDAIDRGDVDEVSRLDDQIRETATGLRDASARGTRPETTDAQKAKTRNVILVVAAVVIACGLCGQLGDGEGPAEYDNSTPAVGPGSEGAAAPPSEEPTITERVEEAQRALDEFDVDVFAQNEVGMAGAIGLFGIYAQTVFAAEAADEPGAAELRRTLAEVQARAFPRFRDAYGPLARAKLWENDMEVRTGGRGFRTIQFTAGAFAANRNIAEFQQGVQEVLDLFRFKRAEYRWYRDAREYSTYTLETPADTDIVGG